MERIGQYSIIRTLGQGGMGVVYLAKDDRLDRHVAIKCVKPEFANSDIGQQLRREARTLAKLNDENIVRLHDLIMDEEHMAVVMEYVDGRNLRELLDQKILGLRARMNLLVQVAQGLAAAHKADVVHRDLKPENILITKSSVAKLTDFGIAKNLDGTDTSVTDFGIIKGTVTAMSPEQLLSEQVDYRSDLFSLGILAYRLLADQLPFTSTSNPVAAAQNVLNEKPTPLNELNDKIPEELANLVLQLLQRDKEDRPNNTEEVALALAVIETQFEPDEEDDDPTVQLKQNTLQLAATQLFERPDSHKEKFSIWRKPKYWLSGLAVLLLLIASGGGYYWYDRNNITYVAVFPPEVKAIGDVPQALLDRVGHLVETTTSSTISNSRRYHYVHVEKSDTSGISEDKQFTALGVDVLMKTKIVCDHFECTIEARERNLNRQRTNTTKTLIDNSQQVIRATKKNLHKLLKIISKDSFYEKKPKKINNINQLNTLLIELEKHPHDEFLHNYFFDSAIDLFFLSENLLESQEKILTILTESKIKLETSPGYWLFLAESNALIGLKDEAISSIKKFKSLVNDPKNEFYQLSKIYTYLGNYKKSEEILKKLVDSDPSIKNQIALANLYLTSNRPSEAINVTSQLITSYPESHDINSYHADSLFVNGLFEDANKYYLKIIKNFEYTPLELSNASSSLLLSKKYEDVIFLIKTFGENTEDSSILLNLADAYKLKNDGDKKYDLIYRKIIENEMKKRSRSDSYIAQSFAQLGLHEEALTLVNELKVSQIDPIYIVEFTKTLVYVLSNNLKLAKISYRSAIKSGNHPYWFNLPWFEVLCSEQEFRTSLNNLGKNSICD